MRRWRLFFILAGLFHLHACASLPVLPPEIPSAEELLHRVEARLQSLQGLKGLARVQVSSPQRNFSAEEVLFVRRPAFLRIESLGPLGTPLFYLVTDGQYLHMYNPGENRYYRGQATARHLSSVLPLDLQAEEAVDILLGGFPLTDYETVSIHWDAAEGLWVLDLRAASGGERQSLWVHPKSLQLHRVEIHYPGSSRQLIFSEFQQVKDFLFPQRIRFISGQPEVQISIAYKEMELNPVWETQDFNLPVPQGTAVLPLE